jgi:hypothetical protein
MSTVEPVPETDNYDTYVVSLLPPSGVLCEMTCRFYPGCPTETIERDLREAASLNIFYALNESHQCIPSTN